MSKYSKTPFVGASIYIISGPQKSKDDMIQLVDSKDQYLQKVDGIVDSVYDVRVTRNTTKKHFTRLQSDGTRARNTGVWLRSGWTHIFVAD